MAEPLILVDCDGEIARITLNDPSRLNVLSTPMMTTLSAMLGSFGDRSDVRAIIIDANGRAFCAGHDLAEVQAQGDADAADKARFEALFTQCTDLMLLLQSLPQPVITLVHGVATAAGCQLVASSDIVLATVDAKFGLNGIDVGLFCSTPMVAASRAMLPKLCFEMLVSGRFISAEEACAVGLVNRVVDNDILLEEGMALGQQIAARQASAIALGKQAFYRQLSAPLRTAYEIGKHAIVDNLRMPETQAKISAFRDKKNKL